MKNQKGITLIALVITIIVLLILAGVSIAMLTGDNGILTKAGNAKEASGKAEYEESIKLAVAEILANKYDPTFTGTEKTITGANIVKLAKASNNNIDTLAAGQETPATDTVQGYATITATVNGKEEKWYVTEKGKVMQTVPDATTAPAAGTTTNTTPEV